MKSNPITRGAALLLMALATFGFVAAATAADAPAKGKAAKGKDRPKKDARKSAGLGLVKVAESLRKALGKDEETAKDADDIASRLGKKKGEEGFIENDEAINRIKNLEGKIQNRAGLKDEDKKDAARRLKHACKLLGDKSEDAKDGGEKKDAGAAKK